MGTDSGPTARHVAGNVRRIRQSRGLTLDQLAGRLAELGHPLIKSGLSKIEAGNRGVDVDDLMALAVALETNPNALLFEPDASDALTDLTESFGVQGNAAWAWACGELSQNQGPWPWARFAKHGGRPNEAFDFQYETRPHDPPMHLIGEDWEKFNRWVAVLNDLQLEMSEAGDADLYGIVLSAAAGRDFSRIKPHPEAEERD